MNTRFTKAAMVAFALAFLSISAMAQPKSAVSIRAFGVSPLDRFDTRFSVGEAVKSTRFSGFELTNYSKIFKNTYFGLPLSLSKIYEPINDGTQVQRKSLLTADFVVHRQFLPFGARLNPFVQAGFGAAGDLAGRDWELHLPVSIGLNVRIAPNFYLSCQSQYRFLGQKKESCQFSAGLMHFFGDKNSRPKKPLAPPADLADLDGDGTPDSIDKCPDVRGRLIHLGCPDRDGDGIPDHEDECPSEIGALENKGCPTKFVDSDNDGIDDQRDECPDKTGLLKFGGCPDSDFDDVPDRLDVCPDAAGPASNKGCPTISADDQKILDQAVQNIQFETGNAAILKSSLPVFDQLAALLARYPKHTLDISGHTDDIGSETVNLRLSTLRAKACFDRLVARGVAAERMVFVGRGSAFPIFSNLSSEGRQRNRRVDFKLIVK